MNFIFSGTLLLRVERHRIQRDLERDVHPDSIIPAVAHAARVCRAGPSRGCQSGTSVPTCFQSKPLPMEAVRFSPFAVLLALPLAPSTVKVKIGDTGAAGSDLKRAPTCDADGTP
jgi:hypothetical protein